MQMPKASDVAKEGFTALVDGFVGVEVRPMFGNLGAFVNGNMFAGLFGETVGVKLIDEASRAELAGVAGTGAFGPADRPMGGYVALPMAWATTPEVAREWIARSIAEVSMLPPKRPKAKAGKGPTK